MEYALASPAWRLPRLNSIKQVMVTSTYGGPNSRWAATGAKANHAAAISHTLSRTANMTMSSTSGKRSRFCRNVARRRCSGVAEAGSSKFNAPASASCACGGGLILGKVGGGAGSIIAKTTSANAPSVYCLGTRSSPMGGLCQSLLNVGCGTQAKAAAVQAVPQP